MRVTQRTIERVSMNIMDALYARFPQIRHIRCTVSKLAPPLGGKLEKVSVVLEK
ncbi:dihydroneopterin aldolase [human gut metagenome]